MVSKSFNKSVELAGTVTVGPKGQVVIPYEVRTRMNIKPGSKLVALYIDEKQSIGFISEERMQKYIDKVGSHFKKINNA